MKSLYVVFPGPGHVEVREEEVSPPGSGEMLCAAQKTLISVGTELTCLRGVFDPGTNWRDMVQYPFRPGYSMVARVVAVGPGVTNFKAGDRVTGWAPHQAYFNAAADQFFPIPDGVNDDDATWATLSVTTQLAVRRAQLALGESVGVVGLGALGQLVVQYLYVAGARKIIAIDPSAERLAAARRHGATDALAIDVREARPAILELTSGRLLDVVYDITGHPAVLTACLPLLHRLGRVILLGDTSTPTQQYLAPGVVSDSLTVMGIHGTMWADFPSPYNPWTRGAMTDLFFDYLLQGRMDVSDLVSHWASPVDAPDIYRRLQEDRTFATGIVFDWSRVR